MRVFWEREDLGCSLWGFFKESQSYNHIKERAITLHTACWLFFTLLSSSVHSFVSVFFILFPKGAQSGARELPLISGACWGDWYQDTRCQETTFHAGSWHFTVAEILEWCLCLCSSLWAVFLWGTVEWINLLQKPGFDQGRDTFMQLNLPQEPWQTRLVLRSVPAARGGCGSGWRCGRGSRWREILMIRSHGRELTSLNLRFDTIMYRSLQVMQLPFSLVFWSLTLNAFHHNCEH